MHIGTFAGYARRLEETSSRTALIAVLAELFAAATPDEVAPATYLLQGRVAPAFVPLELGMGVVLVTEAVARAFHTEPALVRERFDRVGDLGLVVAQLAEEAGRDLAAEATPPVRTVFERLHAIAETSGSGSAARKVALLAGVLTPLDPASAAFVSRLPLGMLRRHRIPVRPRPPRRLGRGRPAGGRLRPRARRLRQHQQDRDGAHGRRVAGRARALRPLRQRAQARAGGESIMPRGWVEPRVVIEVLADEITRSPIHAAGRGEGTEGYALRFPRLVRVRDADKRPEDATTVAEISALYQQQGGTPTPRTAGTAAS